MLLYPALGGGPHSTASVPAIQDFVHKGLAETLGLQQLAQDRTWVIQPSQCNSMRTQPDTAAFRNFTVNYR